MALKLSNNADGLLALAISDSDTSLTLEAGHGSRFPALGSGDWFPITVVRASAPTQLEIMRCTGRSGDTLTVERAQEDTSAIAFDAGDVVELRLTAGTLEENFVSRSDVTTSPTDTTPGRVMKVGDGGLLALPPGTGSFDFDDPDQPNQIAQFITSNATGLTPPGVTGATVLRQAYRAGAGARWYSDLVISNADTGGRVLSRAVGHNGTEITTDTGWREHYHTGNIAKLISDGNLVQTSRTISAGTGLTGGGNLSANRTISLATSHYPIGVGQTWQNVTSSRTDGTVYTNTTGRPIMVAISLFCKSTWSYSFDVAGVMVAYGSAVSLGGGVSQIAHVCAVVPPGSSYLLSFVSGFNITIDRWVELR